ncbi:hypothetical protein DSO57_1018818 [Entomophthora muscae]|uniref:Uncharacterized protein n=1 Tax=Entomophthora muscae TaxID=34485 RepID=A0ACC2SSX0_9FUNG|nr:hypothetical protein DSO57_1018818 [Entomophthora muscae]
MTLPLTLQPNHQMDPTHRRQKNVHSTVWRMVDTMVPNSRPWSLLGKSVSNIIKLAPILWWALPTGPAVPCPESPNASTYAWFTDRETQSQKRE